MVYLCGHTETISGTQWPDSLQTCRDEHLVIHTLVRCLLAFRGGWFATRETCANRVTKRCGEAIDTILTT